MTCVRGFLSVGDGAGGDGGRGGVDTFQLQFKRKETRKDLRSSEGKIERYTIMPGMERGGDTMLINQR